MIFRVGVSCELLSFRAKFWTVSLYLIGGAHASSRACSRPWLRQSSRLVNSGPDFQRNIVSHNPNDQVT